MGGKRRDGMTLLEVLLALAIFLFSLVAISSLFNTATDQAVDIQYRSRAARLAQSKLAEYVAGVRSMQSGGSGNFDEEPEWEWKADIQGEGTAQNLYRVTVTVSRNTPDGRHIETSLSQFVLDPKMKGTITGNSSSSGSTGSTTDQSQTGSTNTGSGSNTGSGGSNTGSGNTGRTNTGSGGNSGGLSGGGSGGGSSGSSSGSGRSSGSSGNSGSSGSTRTGGGSR